MQIIHHRINNIKDLEKIPKSHGIEIDVRYHENKLILEHDPFNHHIKRNILLIDLLKEWKNKGVIILNLKSEGIEDACIEIMSNFKIKNWFFLDLSIPSLVKYSNKAINNMYDFSPYNLSVRFSDKEPIEYVLSFIGKVKWIWVDYFTQFPLNSNSIEILKSQGFYICLVSPEIQIKSNFEAKKIKSICADFNIDAVCTKNPELWI